MDGHKANQEIMGFLNNKSNMVDFDSFLGSNQILPEIAKFYMLQCLNGEDELRKEFTRELAQKILNYLVVSCAGEMRYCRQDTIGDVTDLNEDAQALVMTVLNDSSYGSREYLWVVGYNLTQEFGYPRITQALFEIFNVLSWSSRSVGGAKWANIAKVANQFATGEFSDTIFVDGVMSLVHNNSWAFDINDDDCKTSERLWEEVRNKKLPLALKEKTNLNEISATWSTTSFSDINIYSKYLKEMNTIDIPLSTLEHSYLTKIKEEKETQHE